MDKFKTNLNFSSKNNQVSHEEAHNKLLKNNYFYPSNIKSGINKKFNSCIKQNSSLQNNIGLNKLVKNFAADSFKEKEFSKTWKQQSSYSEYKSKNCENLTINDNLISSSQNSLNMSPYKDSIERTVKSPTGRLLVSSLNHKVNIDYNDIAEKRFYKEACEAGKTKLLTKSIKLSSPDRYCNYNKLETKKNKCLNNYSIGLNSSSKSNYMRPSECVLTELIDSQFSNNSIPKRVNDGSKEDKKSNNYFDDHIINVNLKDEVFDENLYNAYLTFKTQFEPNYENLNSREKIDKIIDSLNKGQGSLKLGAIIFLYIIIKRNKLSEQEYELVLVKTIELIRKYESLEEIFVVFCLELLTLFGVTKYSAEILPLLTLFLSDFNLVKLQKASFNCLMKVGIQGIKKLVDVASSTENSDLQYYILDNLLKTPHIQKIIIIPALLNDLFSNNIDKIHISLAALNRCYDLIDDTEYLKILARLFSNSSIEKQLLASTIRSISEQGESIVLEHLRLSKDFKIKVGISSILSNRIQKYPRYLKMIIQDPNKYLMKKPPGNLYTYIGKVSPIESSEREFTDHLEVNSRDFLAALQRMLMIKHDHSNPKLTHYKPLNVLDELIILIKKKYKSSKFDDLLHSTTEEFDLLKGFDQKNQKNISESVISALGVCLNDENPSVRETAVSSLGIIGLPEAILCLDKIIDLINDRDVNVKSKSIWCLGKLANACDISAIELVINNLSSNVWKVKMACFITITCFGERCAHLVLSLLKKMLKESTINKQIISETIIKLGIDGETCLLDVMRQEIDSNYKLKSAIAKSFALTNINSPNIDFIVECLYKHSMSNSNIIRKAALFSLGYLQEKSGEKITYLQSRHILPFYYKCLNDKDPEIQSYAIQYIKKLGSKGEISLTEGILKDTNYVVPEIGVSTLKTLLISLINDESDLVRNCIEAEILKRFCLNSLISYYHSSITKPSILVTIKNTLDHGGVKDHPKIQRLLTELMSALEKKDLSSQQTENSKLKNYTSTENNNSGEAKGYIGLIKNGKLNLEYDDLINETN